MNKYKKVRAISNDNSCEAPNSDSQQQMNVTKATEIFHKSISIGPEYICMCCDQLWYRSSVTECNPSLLLPSVARQHTILDVIRFQSSLDPVFCSELCRVKS